MPIRSFIPWYRGSAGAPDDEVMARYDLILGSGCPRERRERIRRINPRTRFLVYMNAIDVWLAPTGQEVPFFRDPPPVDPADLPPARGFAEGLWRHHRDFFLKTRAGAKGLASDPRRMYVWGYQSLFDPSARNANRFYLDPRSGWADYFAECCIKVVREGNWDGVMVDNAGARCDWNFDRIADSELRPEIDDAGWGRAMSALLAGVSRRVKEACPGATVAANTCGDFVRPDRDDIEPTDFWRDSRLDGAIEEFFGHAMGANRPAYVTGARWREQVRSILCCEKMGRCHMALANGPAEDADARIYALASFLIAAGEHAVFTYNPAAGPTYPLVYRMPEFEIDLGRPLGANECEGDAYSRRFEKGLVLVNPSEREVVVETPAEMSRLILSGGSLRRDRAGQSMVLPSPGAAILIRE